MIPYGRQNINEEDIEAVNSVLKSDFLTQGPCVPAFEENLSTYCGAKHSVAVNSATSALHIACLALDLGPGDSLWTSPNTFVASSNCALYCGAEVDFVDIDSETFNICIEALSKKLKLAKETKTLPKVVIPVHLCGLPCDMKAIYKLSKEYDFKVIEDASHAIGSFYDGLPTGSCKYSDITVFSFHPVKIITSGEGGAAVTNNQHLADKMMMLRTHGIINNNKMEKRCAQELWNYQQIDLGFNYRMTDIQAALVNNQLKRLNAFVKTRNSHAKVYQDALNSLPLDCQIISKNALSSFHLFVIRLQIDHIKLDHKEFYFEMQKAGVGVNLHYIPVYRHPYYEMLGFEVGYCPEAEKYYHEAISIPLFPDLQKQEQMLVINTLNKLAN
ncbi:UDP-4-amino-4,6-dideoxy-N-acetyl-beta-L-altrosamine transaminase [Gammaproteobacteria bacterium]|nr:UDP-4-amino-4,6-dideoxy-N-acetyl-beta-L-altrosamine transaminase [Gammaproteobacteria bacterium]